APPNLSARFLRRAFDRKNLTKYVNFSILPICRPARLGEAKPFRERDCHGTSTSGANARREEAVERLGLAVAFGGNRMGGNPRGASSGSGLLLRRRDRQLGHRRFGQ